MITQIKTVGVYVDNQQRAVEFYTQKLGFEVRRNEPMGPDSHWIEVAPKGGQSCIVVYPKTMMPEWQRMKPTIVFACSDLEATYNKLSAHGVEFSEKPMKTSWGGYAKFMDPDGNEFVLVG